MMHWYSALSTVSLKKKFGPTILSLLRVHHIPTFSGCFVVLHLWWFSALINPGTWNHALSEKKMWSSACTPCSRMKVNIQFAQWSRHGQSVAFNSCRQDMRQGFICTFCKHHLTRLQLIGTCVARCHIEVCACCSMISLTISCNSAIAVVRGWSLHKASCMLLVRRNFCANLNIADFIGRTEFRNFLLNNNWACTYDSFQKRREQEKCALLC